MKTNSYKLAYQRCFTLTSVMFLAAVLLTLLTPFLYAQPTSSGSTPHVPPGIDYIHRRIGSKPWSIHIARIDRRQKDFSFITTLARDNIFGLQTVRDQVLSLPPELGKPVLAVNADFFVIRPGPYQGDPLGLHIVRSRLVSDPHGTSFWIDSDSKPHIGEVYGQINITGQNGFNVKAGLNEQCGDDSAVLYTPALGPSTRTENCREYLLEPIDKNSSLPLRIGCQYEAKITAVSDGDTIIKPGTMVLSIGKKLADKLPPLAVGATLKIKTSYSPDLSGVAAAIGGGQILIKDGKPLGLDKKSPRHPRTMLGYNRDFYFLVVVDGRQEGLSVGMDYPEQTSLMLELGCSDAINLDGGGSSTFWLNGHIMNSPSDGRERPVANSLILIKK